LASTKHDPLAEALGVIVFLGGIALVGVSFYFALQLFQTPTPELLGLAPEEEIEFTQLGSSAVGVIIKLFLILVMTLLGSVIANRGIRMYASGRAAILKANPDVKEGETSIDPGEEVDEGKSPAAEPKAREDDRA
jgi:hypothetical protein